MDSGTWLALCGLAVVLGVRHGFDADHLILINGFARRNAGSQAAVSKFAGVLFSLGHCSVVVAAACLTLFLAARWAAPTWLQYTGAAVSVTFLLVLAAINLHAAWVTPQGEVVTPRGLRSRLFAAVAARDHPLAIAGVGMLFALSFDTLAQAAALSLAASHFGGLGRVLIAAGCFTLGMLAADGLNGMWIARLIGAADRRAALASRVMTVAVGLLSLAVGLLTIAKMLSPTLGAWAVAHAPLIGVGVVGVMAAAFALAMQVGRRSRARRPVLPGLTLSRETP